VIGVVAAIVATVGDLLLLVTSNAPRPGFEWLPSPSESTLLAGTYLGVLGIPFYGLGYRDVAARFDPSLGRWMTALGVAGGVLGGTTHGLTGLAIHVELTGGTGGVDPVTLVGRYGNYLFPLWMLIGVALVAGSGIYVAGLLGGRSSLPWWTAIANPLAITVVLVLLGATSALGRAFLVPAAPNVAHVVFFAMATARQPRPH
jgi:hypothetical protein